MALRTSEVAGSQSISRAIAILRLMTRRGIDGSRLSELTKGTGLPHPTVRRILKCLEEERLVIQNPETRRYQLGPLNFELGLATMQRATFVREMRPRFERLALRTGDTVYVNLKSGYEIFCADRIDGHSSIRAVTMEVGGRRPMSFGSTGLAMLALLTDDEIERVLESNEIDIQNHARLTRAGLREAVEKARTKGYAVIQDTTVFGVSAIGIALPQTPTRPMIGVALAMVSNRLTPQHARDLAVILKQEFPECAIGADK